ncbi:MAG TPA: PQQ-binding-like beta-propeller repeat protein [Longimicrobiales bacterium]
MLRRSVVALASLLAVAVPLAAQNANWASYNGNLEGTRYSSLAQISATNTSTLRQVCTFDTGEQMSMQSGPVVVDGVLYLTTDTSTYAVDAATCREIWHTARSYEPIGFLKNNHGVAFMDGRLFRVHGGVHAYALDAATGRVLWDVDFHGGQGEGAPMAPIAWNGMVFVGNSGGDNIGVQGHVHALDAATGRELWRFDVVPDTGHARRSWPAGNDVPPTGGGMWSSFTLDPQRGILYVPAGNPAPDFMPELREGANLYTNTILALDARTGRMVDFIQILDGRLDWHDWDVSATPALIRTRGGAPLLALAGKDGQLHGIDTEVPMSILWSVPITTRENVDARLTHTRATRFCPGTQGGTEWNGPAYNPQTNLVYTGAVDWCTRIRLVRPQDVPSPLPMDFTGHVDGGFGDFDPVSQWKGWVTATDPDAGEIRWRYQADTPILAGVTTTAGGIVMTGDMNGKLIVLDATTGRELFEGDTGAPTGAGIVTYQAGGRQYIAVAGGSISPIWPLEPATSRVTIFGLP